MTPSTAVTLLALCGIFCVVCIIIALYQYRAANDLRRALLECANENREQKFIIHRQDGEIAKLRRELLALERMQP